LENDTGCLCFKRKQREKTPEDIVVELEETQKTINMKINNYFLIMEKSKKEARNRAKLGDRQLAISLLQTAKEKEIVRGRLITMHRKLGKIIESFETAALTKESLHGMENANSVLKDLLSTYGLDEIDDVMTALGMQSRDVGERMDALGQDEFDNIDVQDEFAALERELELELPSAPLGKGKEEEDAEGSGGKKLIPA
jgi:hypothetical protein